MLVKIPVSVGELVDKITILEIKLERVQDSSQRENIKKELTILNKKLSKITYPEYQFEVLKSINARIWESEDLIRKEGVSNQFGKDFILYARMIYMYNDMRAEIKKEINLLTDSEIVEEKIY